jgi:hypothetical protein
MTKAQLLGHAIYFLGLEERAKFENRQPLAKWGRRMYEKYRDRLETVEGGQDNMLERSYRPVQGMEFPEEVTKH